MPDSCYQTSGSTVLIEQVLWVVCIRSDLTVIIETGSHVAQAGFELSNVAKDVLPLPLERRLIMGLLHHVRLM